MSRYIHVFLSPRDELIPCRTLIFQFRPYEVSSQVNSILSVSNTIFFIFLCFKGIITLSWHTILLSSDIFSVLYPVPTCLLSPGQKQYLYWLLGQPYIAGSNCSCDFIRTDYSFIPDGLTDRLHNLTICGSLKIFPESLYFWETQNHLSYIPLKIVLLFSYTILPATLKVWKHSWKPICKRLFRFAVAFVMFSVAPQKSCLSMQISVEKTGKNQLEARQESMRMLQYCHVVLC